MDTRFVVLYATRLFSLLFLSFFRCRDLGLHRLDFELFPDSTQPMNSSREHIAGEAIDDLVRPAFLRDGYVVVRGLCDTVLCNEMREQILASLDPLIGPAEFETDVGYPGAPSSRDVFGGDTPRRLLHAYARHSAFRGWAGGCEVKSYLSALLDDQDVCLSQSHHNCVMTKNPGYSSATLWHQDIRYWSFDVPELISVWLALGDENSSNGALKVIPGTHVLEIERGRLDRDLFLRPELSENRQLIRQAVSIDLAIGDVLFFHCRLFHAAGKNRSDEVKLSSVFTYHTGANKPIPGTRSAQYPCVHVRPDSP